MSPGVPLHRHKESLHVNPIEDWLTQPNGLADRLRALRVQAGLAGKNLAEANNWAASKVSRLENGRQMPSSTDIDAWARACGASAATTKELLALLEEVQSTHRDWKRRMRRGQAQVQSGYNQLVQDAALMRGVVSVAALAQLGQLTLQRAQALEPRAHTLELPIDQCVDVALPIRRAIDDIEQPLHVGQRHVEGAAMAHEGQIGRT